MKLKATISRLLLPYFEYPGLVEKNREQEDQISSYKKKLHFYERREYGDEINPLQHNTAEAMDEFFQKIDDVEPYIAFGRSLRKELDERGLTTSGKTVLDWGVGPGIVLHEIVADCNPLNITGYDTSEVALSHARLLFPKGRFAVQDIYNPPQEQFDLVICTEVLEHLENPEAALRTLWQMRNHHGAILLTVPDGRMDYSRLHINFWSPESWSLFLKKNLPDSANVETGTFSPYEHRASRNNFALISSC